MRTKFKLKDVLPNPFRHIEAYPIQREKVEALKQSIASTDFWENIVGRVVNDKLEIAYGHHRLAALRELYKPSQEFEFIVRKLSNDQMLKIMAHENAEEYGSSFWVVLETIRALLEAHAKSEIVDLAVEYQGGHDRYALSEFGFRPDRTETFVTPIAVARYFGWTKKTQKGGPGDAHSHPRVPVALHALRLIATGQLEEAQFRQVNLEAATAIVRAGAVNERQWKQEMAKQEKLVEKAKKAQKEATNERQAAAARRIQEISEHRLERAQRMAKEEPGKAAAAAAHALASGKGYQEAARAARNVVTVGVDPLKATVPNIDEAARGVWNKLTTILSYDSDPTKLTQKLIQLANNSEHLSAGMRRDLVGALRAVAKRAETLADRIADTSSKTMPKSELKLLGVS